MGSWMWDGADELGMGHLIDNYYGIFQYAEDGSVVLRKGYSGEEPLSYTGTYKLALSEKDGMRPGMLSFDLYADFGDSQQPSELHGSFFSEARFFYEIELYQADGDRLFADVIDMDGPYILVQASYDVFE